MMNGSVIPGTTRKSEAPSTVLKHGHRIKFGVTTLHVEINRKPQPDTASFRARPGIQS
jgi:predicted component of type VI protein secretion system